jgi:hypothetical protein
MKEAVPSSMTEARLLTGGPFAPTLCP